MPNAYQTQLTKLAGTDYREVSRKARAIYNGIAAKSKRKPYVRSAYFNKEKVFLDYFWQHLSEKNQGDRQRRLELYACALDLIKNSHYEPTIAHDSRRQAEIIYRFYGKTPDGQLFIVQIKEVDKRKNKYFISVFPYK